VALSILKQYSCASNLSNKDTIRILEFRNMNLEKNQINKVL